MNINFSGVTKIFQPDIAALTDISLDITQGEFVYIIGQTGSGKSTLLRLITRELLPSKGSITVGDYDLRRMRSSDVPYYRRDVGLVAQDFKLIPALTVYENVAFVMETMSVPKNLVEERTKDVINQVGLWRRRSMKPAQLSGGEQQRVAIARALANTPSLFIADEPTGNLDEANQNLVMKIFHQLHDEGHTIITVTHSPDVGKEAEKCVVIEHGHIKNVEASK